MCDARGTAHMATASSESMETLTLLKKRYKEREEQDKQFTKQYEAKPRCAVLPAPECISVGSKSGRDTTKTLQDSKDVLAWLKENNVHNTEFFEYPNETEIEKSSFKSMVNSTFKLAYDAIRSTKSPQLPELVLLYYAGHGLDPKAATELPYLPIPQLNDEANVDSNETLTGGELCLHWSGFCNLNGFLQQWIKVLDSPVGEKKSNKHLVVVLDSCYSGKFADALESLKRQSPNANWNTNGCSITVQAASGADECAIGGYFTPTFLYLNKYNEVLQQLKKEWMDLDDTTKKAYRDVQLPSPVLATSKEDTKDPTIVVNEQNFKVTLFRDSRFFKYCYHSISLEHRDLGNRVMTADLATAFLQNRKPDVPKVDEPNVAEFNVIDYKLKTMKGEAYKDYSLGLFLFEKEDDNLAVCAHVHFCKDDTSKVGRINLVHHVKSLGSGALEFENEYKGGLKRDKHKVPLAYVKIKQNASHKNPDDWFYWSWKPSPTYFEDEIILKKLSDDEKKNVGNAMKLVQECHSFVASNSSSADWDTPSTWNMEASYDNKFRATWMNDYLDRIKDYGLPERRETLE